MYLKSHQLWDTNKLKDMNKNVSENHKTLWKYKNLIHACFTLNILQLNILKKTIGKRFKFIKTTDSQPGGSWEKKNKNIAVWKLKQN